MLNDDFDVRLGMVVLYYLGEFTTVLVQPLLNNNLFICRLKTPA
jgi:hypothetical protein